MLKKLFALAVLSAFFTLGTIAGFGQEAKPKEEMKIDGFRGEALSQIEDAAGKYISLAKATPDDKMGWRPSAKVRSNTEVWMHVANANFLISKGMGAEIPKDLPKEMEKVTDREKVLHYLEMSFRVAAKHIANLKEQDMNKSVDFFGSQKTIRDVIFSMTVHCHNHLGQSIAYARMNGIKPPWAQS